MNKPHLIIDPRINLSFDLVWLIEPLEAAKQIALFESINLDEHQRAYLEQVRLAGDDETNPYSSKYRGYSLDDGVATISIDGSITKKPSSFSGTSSLEGRRFTQNADRDPKVKALLFDIHSGGGESSGIAEWGNEIHKSNTIKPTFAHSADGACSAAIWLGAQAKTFNAGETAPIGSISSFTAVTDSSKALEQEGIKRYYVTNSTGKFKAIGAPGREVTEEHLEYLTSLQNEVSNRFIDAMARGRSMDRSKVLELATGKVYIGQQAKEVGLVDQICGIDDTYQQARNAAKGRVSSYPGITPKGTSMELSELIASLKAQGHTSLANKLQNSDGSVAQVSEILGSHMTEIRESSVSNDPLVSACHAIQVKSPADLTALSTRAEIGNEAHKDLLTETKANAIIALDKAEGTAMASELDTMSYTSLRRMNNGYIRMIDKMGIKSQTPNQRQTAGATVEETGAPVSEIKTELQEEAKSLVARNLPKKGTNKS